MRNGFDLDQRKGQFLRLIWLRVIEGRAPLEARSYVPQITSKALSADVPPSRAQHYGAL
ncbi:hypothetical protein [Roseobacter sp. EG26]|uniref:hypothetical protein n=1 Tax=Roseobacter sp. EG26 TaxID=3412477 RepID=UPI003CE50B17